VAALTAQESRDEGDEGNDDIRPRSAGRAATALNPCSTAPPRSVARRHFNDESRRQT